MSFYPNVGYAYVDGKTFFVCLYCCERYDEEQKAEYCCECLREEDELNKDTNQ